MAGVELNKQRALAGRFAWLGVLAVVLLQLQFALHPQTNHDLPGNADEACEVCLKLDQGGDAPIGDASASRVIPASPAAIDAAPAGRSSDALAPYGARAPPLS